MSVSLIKDREDAPVQQQLRAGVRAGGAHESQKGERDGDEEAEADQRE